MTTAPPIQFQWDGESMVPRVPKLADAHFVVGEVYTLGERQMRSQASHNAYFAQVHDAWQNLREDIAERFPSPDHLRKYALIRAGYRDERSITCASKAEAQRFAAFVKPIDDFALVVVSEATVTIYTAKSQSMKAMGKAEFQKSKDAVLEVLSRLIGTTPTELSRSNAA